MRASHATRCTNGRRVSTKAAARNTTATPQESDESTNAAGSNGVCQNSTDASPCRSTPVYAAVTPPAASDAAASARRTPRGTRDAAPSNSASAEKAAAHRRPATRA